MRIQVNKLTLSCHVMPWMALGFWGESTRAGRASKDVAAPTWTSQLPEQETKQALWFNLWYSVTATENKVRHVAKLRAFQIFLLCYPFSFQCLPLRGALNPPCSCQASVDPPLSSIPSARSQSFPPLPHSPLNCWHCAYVPPYLAI